MTNIKLQNKDLKDEWEDTGITFHGSYTQAERRLSKLLESGDLLMGEYRLIEECEQMNAIVKFINDMKTEYGITDREVLQAIQEEPQHDFITRTQGCSMEDATRIIEATENFLMEAVGCM